MSKIAVNLPPRRLSEPRSKAFPDEVFDHWLDARLRETYGANIDRPLPAEMHRLLRLIATRD